MTLLRVLIVDDEAFARQRLRRLLSELPDVDIVGEAANGREAVALITSHDPDVVLLDVQMPRVDGFGVLRALDGPAPLVIFVTAFDEHAVAAFNIHAFDYILKPVEPARFAEAIERHSRSNVRRCVSRCGRVTRCTARRLVEERDELRVSLRRR